MLPNRNKSKQLNKIAYDCLIGLATEDGINASGKDEIYGCIFGRDSAITVLKILNAHTKNPSPQLLEIAKRSLLKLVSFQGKETNLESGEELGKFIHEFRKDKFEHLINNPKPWYIYPDFTLRNYDSIDSTPLGLIAIYKYWQTSKDTQFLAQVLGAVNLGLSWIINSADKDRDYLVEYELSAERSHGGLPVQSWTDSYESLLQPDGKIPQYPIAPVEAQGYVWLTLKLWADFYKKYDPPFAQKLLLQAQALKKRFNETFIIKDQGYYFAAQAVDGQKNKISVITGNPLLLLWATYTNKWQKECIIERKFIKDFIKRAFLPDLFDPEAGIHTMSTLSPTYNPSQNSYHNGSFWPILNGMVYEGLVKWGMSGEAAKYKKASLKPLEYFGTPIELYTKGERGELLEYRNAQGQTSCKTQAWSAAAMLDMTSEGRAEIFKVAALLRRFPQELINLTLLPFNAIPQIPEFFR